MCYYLQRDTCVVASSQTNRRRKAQRDQQTLTPAPPYTLRHLERHRNKTQIKDKNTHNTNTNTSTIQIHSQIKNIPPYILYHPQSVGEQKFMMASQRWTLQGEWEQRSWSSSGDD